MPCTLRMRPARPAAVLAAVLAVQTACVACRLEPVGDSRAAQAPAGVVPADPTQRLAWSRDVTVIGLAEPSHGLGASTELTQVVLELCQELTLQRDLETAWLMALNGLEHSLSVHRFVVREALVASSDGRWGAAIQPWLAPSLDSSPGPAMLLPLVPTAWQQWQRGSGLGVELAAQPPGAAPTQPATEHSHRARGVVDAVPIEDPPKVLRIVDAAVDEDDGGSSDALAAGGGATVADHAGAMLLMRLSDGSFRGAWLGAWLAGSPGPPAFRDGILGERLFVGTRGAVFISAASAREREPSAASRTYERLLQPGSGTPRDAISLTHTALVASFIPGLVAFGSRGAVAGSCRVINQEREP